MALKVMVVDDEPAIVDSLKSLMEYFGFAVSAFTDSREAAAQVGKQKFDAVFLDVRMPAMDGFELTRCIRTSPSNSRVPIVMLTGHDDVETMRKGRQAGITFFLGKPISLERLRSLLTITRGAMLNEKRRFARLPIRATVNCQAGETKFKSWSLNISEAGMLLENSARLARGQSVELEFPLPLARRPLRLHSLVVRLQDPNYMGVQFVGLAPQDLATIRDYIIGLVKE